MTIKRLIALAVGVIFLGVAVVATLIISVSSNLPQMIKLEDYKPLLVSQVYDRKGVKIGEFKRETRILVPYDKIPKQLVDAFVSAEDSSFFEHSGINFVAIVRAAIANVRAGRKVQGGSTITQQVARSLLLSSEKTYTRKIKEAILAYRMETNLSKQDILYLYLNQIYLGQGAYGVGAAADIYFRKTIDQITLGESALLAGLPQAPTRYSPIKNPSSAKERQKYVLDRMAAEGAITKEQAETTKNEPLQVYVRETYQEQAPYYLEIVRQLLVAQLGEDVVLDKGIKIYTGLDSAKQAEAQKQVRLGLRELDKRQGFRGAIKKLENSEDIAKFLLETRNTLMDDFSPIRTIRPDGTIVAKGPLNLTGKDAAGKKLPVLPDYILPEQIVDAVVTKVDDEAGVVWVRFAETKGLIDFETMKWARKADPTGRESRSEISKPSEALAKGDVIKVGIISATFNPADVNSRLAALKKKQKDKYKAPTDLPVYEEFASVQLEQEPLVESSLISFDQTAGDVLALVGGYDFRRSEFNRALQAARQTGSSFKALVYAAALDKGYTPASMIIDAPLVYEESKDEGQVSADAVKKWKPTNHGEDFTGEILFRTALIKSLNVPTVKIIEDIGVDWVASYARRLGIFSPLNMDFTLGLGSSGVTLYEMTRAFAQVGRLGRRLKPLLIKKVESLDGEVLAENLGIDDHFKAEMEKLNESLTQLREAYSQEVAKLASAPAPEGEEGQNADRKTIQTKKVPPLFFEDPDQLMRPTTAYLTTSLLQAVIDEPGGTGGAARALGRPAAGKTGTTSDYFDAWFIGFTPDIATGVWVGFDQEKTLGRGEVGGRSALPIWLEYMKFSHEGLPSRGFAVPDGIVFANIDSDTGKLASATSKKIVRQAFLEGTEPQEVGGAPGSAGEDQDFFKEDLAQ